MHPDRHAYRDKEADQRVGEIDVELIEVEIRRQFEDPAEEDQEQPGREASPRESMFGHKEQADRQRDRVKLKKQRNATEDQCRHYSLRPWVSVPL